VSDVPLRRHLPDPSSVREVRRHLAARKDNRGRGEGDFERVSVPEVDCEALRDLLVAERARVVIEIGLAYGSSALAIGEALVSAAGDDDVQHLIIDAYQDRFENAGCDAIREAGLSDICSLVRERSQLALPLLVSEGFVADAAFVDGSHHFHNVFADLYFLRELVRPGGVIVVDDFEWPSVCAAVRYFEVNLDWRLQSMGESTRLRALRLPDELVDPRFESFVDTSHDNS
jgi:predicted O-methyltransferase YrrM